MTEFLLFINSTHMIEYGFFLYKCLDFILWSNNVKIVIFLFFCFHVCVMHESIFSCVYRHTCVQLHAHVCENGCRGLKLSFLIHSTFCIEAKPLSWGSLIGLVQHLLSPELMVEVSVVAACCGDSPSLSSEFRSNGEAITHTSIM